MAFRRDIYLERFKNRERNGLIKIITGSRRADEN